MVFLSLGALSFIFFDMFSYNQDPLTQPKIKYVASIDDTHHISYNDFNMEYNIVTQNFLSEKDKEKSEEEIFDLILDRLINKNLIYLYGIQMGISVYDNEVKDNIKLYTDFHHDGKFSTKLYKKKLEEYKITFKAFEENVRKDLMIEKVFSYLKIKPLDGQEELFYGDLIVDLSYNEIPLNSIQLNYTDFSEKDYFDYWMNNKSLFKTKDSYDVELFYEEGKSLENKKKILEIYQNIEKSTGKLVKNYQFNNIEKDKINEIINSDKVLLPFEYNEGYLIVKVIEKHKSREKTYTEAEDDVKKMLIGKDFYEQVEKYVQKIDTFEKNIPIFSMLTENSSLTNEYDKMFKKNMFSKEKYFLTKDRKLVVFKVNNKYYNLNRNLSEKENLQIEVFNRLILQKELLKFLKNNHKIEKYIKK